MKGKYLKLAIALGLAVAILLLVVFFQTEPPADPATTPDPPAPPVAPVTAPDPPAQPAEPFSEHFTISWVGFQMAPLGSDPFILRYMEEKFNVTFDIWNLDWAQFDELLNIRLAAGEVPDMFMSRNPSDLPRYVQQGILAPIPDEYIQRYMPLTLQNAWTEQFPGALDLGRIDGDVYGLPAMNRGNRFRQPIMYNGNWLNTLGMDVPTTIDEFEAVIYAFAHNDPDGDGVNNTFGLSQDGLNVLWGMFGMVPHQDYFAERDGRVVFMPIEPEMREALEIAHRWFKDGVLDPEFVTGENHGGDWAISHPFINQRIGMTNRANFGHYVMPGTWMEFIDGAEVPNNAGRVTAEMLALDPDALVVFGNPLYNRDGVQGGVRGWNLLMRFYSIGAQVLDTPGKMQRILEIMEYTSGASHALGDPAGITFSRGFQGEHWDWTEQERGQYRILDPHTDTSRFEWGGILWWVSGADSGARSRAEEWAESVNLHHGGIFSVLPQGNEVTARYNAHLETLRQTSYIQFITGARPLDEFDDFVAEYLAQGGQAILDSINASR